MYDLDKNDHFCEMRVRDKKRLLKYLKNYYIEYKPSLGLDDEMTFGIEIECEVPYSECLNGYDAYSDFKLEKELSAGHNGFEFKSPKLHDTVECWNEIKQTCEYLKRFCLVNSNCGGHIHFGADIFQDNTKYLKNLIYLWMAYEDIIYRFGNGETINTRFSADIYARPTVNVFEYFIMHDELFNDINKFLSIFKNITRNLGLNFNNYFLYYTHDNLEKNTVEMRTPNGTLEEVIWQNNVNFFGNLLKSAINDDLDLTKLYFNIYGYDVQDDKLFNEYSRLNFDKALELADLIYDNNRDKLDFLKQYVKNEKNTHYRSLVKVKKFWV